MAKANSKAKPKKRWKFFAIVCLTLLLCLAMRLSSKFVRVRYAEVALNDLPKEFDGTTILYVADIDTRTYFDVYAVSGLLNSLQTYQPDLILISGDYATKNLIDVIANSSNAVDKRASKVSDMVSSLSAPLGVFTDKDLQGNIAIIKKGDAKIGVCGVNSSMNASNISAQVTQNVCVLAIADSPDSFIDISVSEAKGGGYWCDYLLCGGTHGGQVRLFGRNILNLSEAEQKYLRGIYTDPFPMLVSQGVGNEMVGFRIGSSPEVWLITLKCFT